MTENFIPNKIKKIISNSENIYTTENCCILKISDKDNLHKILKISNYNEDEYDLLLSLKQSDNKYLLKPEIVEKKNGFIYAVYPYKKSLIENISSGNFGFNNLLDLALNLCDGIIFLHEKKYLHLDISPDNIYLNNDNSFCLGDYSAVRKSGKKLNADKLYVTPDFSPPEFMALSKNKVSINELSDEYSLGKTLLSLFELKNDSNSNDNINLTKELISILKKACSEIQEFRYSSISEFKNVIIEFKDKNKEIITNFKFNAKNSDYMFDNLKTIPINRAQTKVCQNRFFSFFNTPVFMTAAILLAVLLPAMTLYNIFFLPHMSVLPPDETSNSITFTSTRPNNTADKLRITDVVSKNTSPPTTPFISNTPSVNLPQDRKNTPDVAQFSDILYLNEFDVKKNIIKTLSADTLKKIAGKKLDDSSLKILSANNNSINDITGITSFQNIEELYLSGNKIKNIDALSELKHLKTLVISSNLIDDIYMLSKIKTLENLDLSCNRKLKNIMPLTNLKSLKLLCLNDTNIPKKQILKLKRSLPDCEIVD